MWKHTIPIDSAILAAIGHRFIANKKKLKNADARAWGDARRDQGTILKSCLADEIAY